MRQGLKPEDLIHKQFASQINSYQFYGKLNCVFWTYSASGESRSVKTGSLLKSKGLKKGQPDFHFIIRKKITYGLFERLIDFNVFLEFKAGKNKQTAEQLAFQSLFKDSNNSKYFVAYSVDEAISVLEKEGIVLA